MTLPSLREKGYGKRGTSEAHTSSWKSPWQQQYQQYLHHWAIFLIGSPNSWSCSAFEVLKVFNVGVINSCGSGSDRYSKRGGKKKTVLFLFVDLNNEDLDQCSILLLLFRFCRWWATIIIEGKRWRENPRREWQQQHHQQQVSFFVSERRLSLWRATILCCDCRRQNSKVRYNGGKLYYISLASVVVYFVLQLIHFLCRLLSPMNDFTNNY